MKTLAIIGFGPRGLYALENLLIDLSKSNRTVEIVVFEASETLGAGHVWKEEQPDSNWINITERALSGIEKRPKIKYGNIIVKGFPSYHQWCNFSLQPSENDTFPSRNKLGRYLNERYDSIEKSLGILNTFKIISVEVQSIDYNDNGKVIVRTNTESWVCDDVLLTIGHQPTELSEQMKTWKSYAKSKTNVSVFENPYPVSNLNVVKNTTDITMGIRGFGLGMIDVMRYLVINNFGNFKVVDNATLKTVYYKVKKQHLTLIPFSLDGLPLVPKPLNEIIDNWYKPTNKELGFFKAEIEAVAQTEKEVHTIDFLTKPMATIASRIFLDLKEKAFAHKFSAIELEAIVTNWLKNDDFQHELLQDENIPIDKLIQTYIDMALGEIPVSLDFCIGQVWRHCQPTLYAAFSHAKSNSKTIKKVIDLDERSKRYSYGPPIESMQQVLALVDANVLNLDFVNDPHIELESDGWLLTNAENKIVRCSVMINSILDAPKLLEINTDLVKSLLQNDLIQPIHSELGIETSEDGYVITPNDQPNVPIAVLGRLAKGSVIGVDAILECFGPRIEDWATAYVAKLED
ncbi:FAD/NAD(P)-binding protein [Winogradskyella schleiferi]|uniref:FAD/NAD(P)-binding protein n=1 Tax=Winogradskyella schleiferi TaxID=2686078 RepID=UPI0015B8BAC7|nr:FAD/NAD(P)-binding protein [Winogradskyella schleiferi]